MIDVKNQMDDIETKIDTLSLRKFKYQSYLSRCLNTEAPVEPTLYADSKNGPAALHLRNQILGNSVKSLNIDVDRFSTISASSYSINSPSLERAPPSDHSTQGGKQQKALMSPLRNNSNFHENIDQAYEGGENEPAPAANILELKAAPMYAAPARPSSQYRTVRASKMQTAPGIYFLFLSDVVKVWWRKREASTTLWARMSARS